MRPMLRKKKGKHDRRRKSERPSRASLAVEQPFPESTGNVPCPRCNHLVDPKRMHFHMERVHGVRLPSKSG